MFKHLLCAQRMLSQLSMCYLISAFAFQMRELVGREKQPATCAMQTSEGGPG